MLALERRNRIIARLMSEGNVVVSELSREYNVTEETIRRDLDRLERDGFAKKTYGGATRAETAQVDLPYRIRRFTNVQTKQCIAELLAGLITDNDSIALDASSSSLYAARALVGKHKLSMITNSIETLSELAGKTDWNILATGGSLKDSGLSLIGSHAEQTIESFHVKWAILSCKGVDASIGFMDSSEEDAQIKRAFIKRASNVIFLVDSSKLNNPSFVTIAPLSAASVVITDTQPSDDIVSVFEEQGVRLIYPKASGNA